MYTDQINKLNIKGTYNLNLNTIESLKLADQFLKKCNLICDQLKHFWIKN